MSESFLNPYQKLKLQVFLELSKAGMRYPEIVNRFCDLEKWLEIGLHKAKKSAKSTDAA
jgi:hypothetical protein